uniref:DUF721 domain-containing protein n=1 Tax=candidate division WOR-3 bacterium TaxID=2052148 RepID=A0A7C4U669_UNCW3
MKPIKIEKILEIFVNSDKFIKGKNRVLVFDKYNEIVKETFKDVSSPFKFEKDVLIVKVVSSSHLNEIYFFKQEILKRLNMELEGIFVKDIKFIIGDENGIQCK